ncbi:MAG TPA: hypothetical protein VND45_09440, partial [Thermoanaerobaculia bacterium]|nr:hypothetical protein [Thermoanaerobaculia bacterium]
VEAFDLASARISVELRHATSGGAHTLFAAARDAANWFGFRVENGQLHCESRNGGRPAAKTIPYDRAEHRFLRLRMSGVAPVVVWETSADGSTWTIQYVETPIAPTSRLSIALSAGTIGEEPVPGQAVFDNVRVEANP